MLNRRRFAVVLCLAFALGGCKRRPSAADAPKEEPVELLSAFQIDDPRATVHLTHGFYALEGRWRWASPKFGMMLAPPEGAAERGARLELKVNVPPPAFDRVGAVTLSGSVNGIALGPEKFASAGDHVYAREIAKGAFANGPVVFEFQSDKAFSPSSQDTRELTLIVTGVALTANPAAK